MAVLRRFTMTDRVDTSPRLRELGEGAYSIQVFDDFGIDDTIDDTPVVVLPKEWGCENHPDAAGVMNRDNIFRWVEFELRVVSRESHIERTPSLEVTVTRGLAGLRIERNLTRLSELRAVLHVAEKPQNPAVTLFQFVGDTGRIERFVPHL